MIILPDIKFEKSLIPSNCRFLLGIDEVGRGPWAGPVSIGVFLLDLETFKPSVFKKLKVRDSKLLNSSQRQNILDFFKQNGFDYQVFSRTSQEIDQHGLQNIINQTIQLAVEAYQHKADFVLVDGNMKLDLSLPYQSIIKGDQKCFSIASAAICAKVTRDLQMVEFHFLYPQYDFATNKGYGTKKHQSALIQHGPCPIHRCSFKPIKLFSSAKNPLSNNII